MRSLFIVKILMLFNLVLNLFAQDSINTNNLTLEKKISIPLLEEYNVEIDPGKYFDSVYKFISENPESKYIPRICYDFYLAALGNSNGDLIKKGKALLFIEGHPSVYSSEYLSSVPDAAGFRDLVKDITYVIDSSDKDKVEPLCKLIRFGFQKFKSEVMGDEIEFPILMFSHASLVKDEELSTFCASLINNYVEKDNSNLIVTKILFSENLPYQKYISFAKLDTSLGNFAANLYYDYLTEAEQAQPEIIISRLEEHYKSKQFEKILRDIKELPEEKKGISNIMTLKALALFGLKQDENAIETLKKTMDLVVSKEQEIIIKDFISYIKNFNENKKTLGELLPKFSNNFLSGELVLEADISFSDPSKQSKSNIYIAINLTENYVELHVLDKQELIIAFKVKDDNTMIYINSEKSIWAYNGTAVYPVPSITLDRSRDGGFNFLMGFHLSTNISSLSSSSFKLFGSPYFSTAHGVHEIYDYTARSTSNQITPNAIDEENVKIKFSEFDWKNLKTKSMDLMLDKNHAIKRIDNLNDTNNLKFNRFFLSANKKYIFSPPAWPDMPVVKKGDFDTKQFMVLFGQIMDIMSESISK